MKESKKCKLLGLKCMVLFLQMNNVMVCFTLYKTQLNFRGYYKYA